MLPSSACVKVWYGIEHKLSGEIGLRCTGLRGISTCTPRFPGLEFMIWKPKEDMEQNRSLSPTSCSHPAHLAWPQVNRQPHQHHLQPPTIRRSESSPRHTRTRRMHHHPVWKKPLDERLLQRSASTPTIALGHQLPLRRGTGYIGRPNSDMARLVDWEAAAAQRWSVCCYFIQDNITYYTHRNETKRSETMGGGIHCDTPPPPPPPLPAYTVGCLCRGEEIPSCHVVVRVQLGGTWRAWLEVGRVLHLHWISRGRDQ